MTGAAVHTPAPEVGIYESTNAHIRANAPFKCDWDGCNYAGVRNGHLKIHRRTHTQEKSFQCDWGGCDRACTTRYELKVHTRIHTGERPYACDTCHKSFTQRSHLTTHQRIHTGKRPYACDTCHKRFIQRAHLKTHQDTHTGDRPVKCDWDGCDYACARKYHLNEHRRTHTGHKPFKCAECNYTGTQSAHLKWHFKANHTKEGIQRRKKQEERVAKALTAASIEFEREIYVSFKCFKTDGHYSRIDFVIDMGSFKILLEVDEDQHREPQYDITCETRRMADIVTASRIQGVTRPLVFIRYNPHACRHDGELVKKLKKDREAELVRRIKAMEYPKQDLSIMYMYYDMEGDLPVIVRDPRYSAELAKCVLQP